MRVSGLDSKVAADALNLEHRLGVFLHEVLLVGVGAVDVLHALAKIVLFGVRVHVMGVGCLVARGLTMGIRREDLRECVAHLQLPVERLVKVSRHGI